MYEFHSEDICVEINILLEGFSLQLNNIYTLISTAWLMAVINSTQRPTASRTEGFEAAWKTNG